MPLEGSVRTRGRTPLPRTLAICLSTKCNFRCYFCRRDHGDQRADLPLERLDALLPAIRAAEVVDITGWGEPFMLPHIEEAIRRITAVNPRHCISVTTNGSHLRERYAALLSQNLHHVVFSLNAATRETYERDMVHGRWEQVLANVRTARKHIPREKVILSFVANRDNVGEFPAFVRLAAELGARRASMTPLIVTQPGAMERCLWFHKELTNRCLEEAIQEGARLGVEVACRKFPGLLLPPAASPCESPFTESFVTIEGDVGACCYAGNQRMGNAFGEGGFEAVWQGEAYERLRAERHFPECKACFAWASLEDLATHLGKGLDPGELYAGLPRFTALVPVDASTSPALLQSALRSLDWQTFPFVERRFAVTGGLGRLPSALQELVRGPGGAAAGESILEWDGGSHAALVGRAAAAAQPGWLAWLPPEVAWHPQKLEQVLQAALGTSPAAAAQGGARCTAVVHAVAGLRPDPWRRAGAVERDAARAAPAAAAALLLGGSPPAGGFEVRELPGPLDLRVGELPPGPRHEGLAAAARALNAAGEQAFAGGDAPFAAQAFLVATMLHSGVAESWSNLAVIEWSRGRAEAARDLLAVALSLEPGNPVFTDNARLMQGT